MQRNRLLVGSRVVPFEQSGTFYYKRAHRHLSQFNYLGALTFFRRAVDCEPENAGYLLDMAETFTEMNLYDESNQILFNVMRMRQPDTSECFFAIGCNFMGLQEYDRARESFRTYVRLDPEGDYREEADDMLTAMEEEEMQEELPPEVYSTAMRGKEALDANNYDEAVTHLSKALAIDGKLHFVRNNLALAYYCMKDMTGAIEQTAIVLGEEPDNLHANCNMALFLKEEGDETRSQQHLDRALSVDTDDPDEQYKVCLTLCEMRRHAQVYERVKALLSYRPYDKKTLHYLAVAAYNTGRYAEARDSWNMILRIDPQSTIAPYYLKRTRAAEKGQTEGELTYHYQVPHDEILLRIWNINRIVRESAASIAERYSEDEELRQLVRWGLELNDAGIKRALLSLLALVRDAQSEEILRQYLTKRGEPDELKREVFGFLKQMGAAEPYIAFIDRAMVEVRVSVMETARRLPPEYEHVLQAAVRELSGRYDEDFAAEIIFVWETYVKSLNGHFPRISRRETWVAAIEWVYCARHGLNVHAAELCRRYGTTNRTLKAYAQKIMDALEHNNNPDK